MRICILIKWRTRKPNEKRCGNNLLSCSGTFFVIYYLFLANLSIVEQYGLASENEYLLNDILKDEWAIFPKQTIN
jgi:hypothetical protein